MSLTLFPALIREKTSKRQRPPAMASGQISAVVRFIKKLTGSCKTAELADGSLLDHFVRLQDENAFATLMHRHGPLVVSVCRSILGNEADVEDAFQATFLVLVRK